MNYDELVIKPEEEIKSLLDWLDWDWDSKYLKPNLDGTTIGFSNISKSEMLKKDYLGSWKNYRELLSPAIKIFEKNPLSNPLIKSFFPNKY